MNQYLELIVNATVAELSHANEDVIAEGGMPWSLEDSANTEDYMKSNNDSAFLSPDQIKEVATYIAKNTDSPLIYKIDRGCYHE